MLVKIMTRQMEHDSRSSDESLLLRGFQTCGKHGDRACKLASKPIELQTGLALHWEPEANNAN